ncbi:MAG: glycosyltransferase family 4 protein [Pseudomonadota bacterium]
MPRKTHFLIGTRWFGVLGPCNILIDRLVADGYQVFVFGQIDDHYQRYDTGDARLVPLFMTRSYFSPLRDILDVLKLMLFILWYRPENIHSFNPKPALLSFAASQISPSSRFFIGVTGLGNSFIRAPMLEPAICFALRLACLRARFVFFQNPDDVALFRDKKLVHEDKIRLFIGPGVDLQQFTPKRMQPGKQITIACTARLIWQKGIREFVDAARIIRARHPNKSISFKLYGEFDFDHPDCVDPDFIQTAVKDGIITHIPWTNAIDSALRAADIFVLHSYREGAPRAILEAAASALPTIGSDAIGVRELVRDQVTGFLTPLHDTDALADKLEVLIRDADLRHRMGQAARRLIAEPLSLAHATDAQMKMYTDANPHSTGSPEWI